MSYAKIQEKADEVRLLLLEKAADMAKSPNPLSVLIAAETVRRVSAAQPPTPPVIGEDIAGMVGTLHPMTNHVVDVDVGERGEIKTIDLKSQLAPQITLHRCADGAFRTDPNWVPVFPTAALVPLKGGETISPDLTLFEGADGAWRSDPDWQPPAPAPAPTGVLMFHHLDKNHPRALPEALYENADGTWREDPSLAADPHAGSLARRLDHFRAALEYIGATRYGLAARQALAGDAAFVVDPTQPLTFTPPPPRKGTDDAPASVPPPVVAQEPAPAVPELVPAPLQDPPAQPPQLPPLNPTPEPLAPPPPPAGDVQPRWPVGCHTAWGIAPENPPKSGLAVMHGDAVEFTDIGTMYLSHHVKVAWTGLLLPSGINVAPVSVDTNASRYLTEGLRVRFRQSGVIGRLVKLPAPSPSV